MKKISLITGASSGIGLELAKLFANDGHDLLLVARSSSKLESLKKQLESTYKNTVYTKTLDLSKHDSALELQSFVNSQEFFVEQLVNNAGVGVFGTFTEKNLEEHLSMLQLNIMSLTSLTYYFLKEMLKKNEGKILNVSSTAAFQGVPKMSTYAASKAYVLSFSEALSQEVSGTNVTVTALCPGATESKFQKTAQMDKVLMFKKMVASASSVAKYGYKAMKSGKAIAIPGVLNKLLSSSTRFSPRNMNTAIASKLMSEE